MAERKGAPPRKPSGKPSGKPAGSKSAPKPRFQRVPGMGVRNLSVALIRSVLVEGRFLDDALTASLARDEVRAMEHRDRAMARLIAATVLRRRGQIDPILRSFLAKPLSGKTGNLWPVLQCAAVQLLFLDTPPHAAINIAVEQCTGDRTMRRLGGLANAVLRKVATQGPSLVAAQDAGRLATPDWLWDKWVASYGQDVAHRIAVANLGEAALDISVKASPKDWASKLGGVLLPTGSIRLRAEGRIEDLPGFAAGHWWVQDAAAALPARLLGDVAGKPVADLCASPGGKTAQLAAAGANVTAVDISEARQQRLRQNLDRLKLSAKVVTADVTKWQPDAPFDAVLLDAPCTATGTMRRHPDIAHLKRAGDIAALTVLQAAMLDQAVAMLRPGGVMVFSTCSLHPEEGPDQIAAALTRHSCLERVPVQAGECAIESDWLTPLGELRTLPCHLPIDPPAAPPVSLDSAQIPAAAADAPIRPGLDGFFAARLRRTL